MAEISGRNKALLLHQAVAARSLRAVRQLVSLGADVNASFKRTTPLHIAAKKACDQILEYLLNNGADVNARDKTGATPLYYCVRDNPSIMVRLLAKGCIINAETDSGQTALLKAVREGKLLTGEFLLNVGVDFSVEGNRRAFKLALSEEGPEYRAFVEKMIQAGFLISADDVHQPDFLFGAIYQSHFKLVEELLDFGASVNQHYSFKKRVLTPLHLAVESDDENMVKLLLERGADYRVSCYRNDPKSTPMAYAIIYASIDIMKLLAKKVELKEEPYLLHTAVANGSLEKVRFLLEKGCPGLNTKNNGGEKPLSIAVSKGCCESIKVLIRFGAHVCLTDLKGTKTRFRAEALEAFLDRCFKPVILETSIIFQYSVTTPIFPFHHLVEVFAKHLIKMEVASQLDSARILLHILLYEEYNLDDFQSRCESETKAMKIEKVGFSNATFYDVLVKSQTQVARFARNPNFERFEPCDVKSRYPIYSSILIRKIYSGILRRSLLKRAMTVLSISPCFSGRQDNLKELVLDFLSNQDLFILQKCLPDKMFYEYLFM